MVYQPYRATVTFIKSGEPEIIMQENFSCDRQHTPEDFAFAIAKHSIGIDWLWEAIEIVSITYWVKQIKENYEPNYAGAHRR